MGIRTGQQYMDGLKSRQPEVWLRGKRVTDLLNEPVFRNPIRELAHLYDLQHHPEYQERITHICKDTGQRVSNAFLVPRNYEDLVARRNLYEVWAQETFGLMGRSPDFLNVVVTSFASNRHFFAQYNTQWAENIQRYYEYIRDNDLFLTHAIINPQNDRGKQSHQQADPFTHLGLVEETKDGIIVRGAKMLATLAPITDEVIVYSFPGFQPGDERYALAFAIPIDTPGLRILCREPMQDGTRPVQDHPLASRFEEMDAVLVFHDVLVPWDRVFMYGNCEAANKLYSEVSLSHSTHQNGVRGLVKLSFAAQVAARLADSIGVDGYLNVQTQLGELMQAVETIRALLRVAEYEFVHNAHGEACPAWVPLETIRGHLPKMYPRAVEIIQTIGAGGLLLSPTYADFENEELRADLDKFYVGRTGVAAEDRVQLFKLAWDLCGEAFGQRMLQYERYYSGDPIRKLGMFYNNYKRQNEFTMVDRALEGAFKQEPQLI